MAPRPLSFIVQACAGELKSGSPAAAFSRVCSDSRQVQAGDAFFALAGEQFDGHQFLSEAARKGAAVVVVDRRRSAELQFCAPACGLLLVDDTRKAMGRLAAGHRREFNLPVIAVAGSNGKTTTKELLAAVLRQKLATLWSEASFNNDIGVPLTLLRLEEKHQAAVVEVGTNHPGELQALLELVQPRYGVLTCVGREHLEFFKDLAGVAQEEGWLAETLPASGKLFLNGDGEWTTQIAARARAAVVKLGFGVGNDWRVTSLRTDKQGVAFRVEGPAKELSGEYRVNLLGRHQAANALFAIAVGGELGLGRTEIERGLAECKPAKMRLQLWELNGVRVLDDAYNANADSAMAALQTLVDLPCKGRRVAVLGDMAELGAHSEAAHQEVGRRVAELGVAQLFTVGQMASLAARGAREAGLSRVLEFSGVEAAGEALKKFVREGDLVLLKASRAMRLERVAESLRMENGRKNPCCIT